MSNVDGVDIGLLTVEDALDLNRLNIWLWKIQLKTSATINNTNIKIIKRLLSTIASLTSFLARKIFFKLHIYKYDIMSIIYF